MRSSLQNEPLDCAARSEFEAAGGNRKLVSVVITCYNQARYLAEAIESVLAQTYTHFELIVIDDGSSDNTPEVAQRYENLIYIRQENKGLSGARNRGIKESKGDYLIFLDADDRLMRKALAIGVDALSANPDNAFVSGHYIYITADNKPLSPSLNPCVDNDHYTGLLRGNYIGMHATVTYRRSVFETVGGFDTSLAACEDYDLYLRVARKYAIRCHHELVAEYRRHEDQMSRDPVLMLKSVKAVLDSQKRFIKGNRLYEEASRRGMIYWQENLITRIAHNISAREWRSVAQGMIVLLLCSPRRFGLALTKQARQQIEILRVKARASLYRLRRQTTRDAALKERLLHKEMWARGINDELKWWRQWLSTEEGAQWKREVQNPRSVLRDRLITDRIKQLSQDSISILDVGAGPVTSLGYTYPGKSIAITASDPLAKQYRRMLESAMINAPVKTAPCHGEQLLDRYAANSFDFVYACNSLDHSYDPLLVIRNMLALAKKDGYVVLRHYKNEAKTGNYDGMHQWNFDIKRNDLIIWNKECEYKLSEIIGDGFKIDCWYEDSASHGAFEWSDWVVCVIKK